MHTFPELGLATFNLYCCRPRPPWPWSPRLRERLAAREVTVRAFARGHGDSVPAFNGGDIVALAPPRAR
ncbi:MAG: hypothetical protein NVS3B20_22580 [Polyangiales bacterium]